MLVETSFAVLSLALAVSTRPWRALTDAGPPWPWLAWLALMPWLWSADRLVAIPAAQPLSGACLLMLMAGWPMAVLAMLPVAVATAWLGDLGLAGGLHRLVWLGLLPATLGMVLGAAVRRWLPHHLMVYILGRGFIGTALAGTLTGALAAVLDGAAQAGGLSWEELTLGRMLAAWGDAWLCGVLVAIFVAFRPQWLSTYTDRLYLPR